MKITKLKVQDIQRIEFVELKLDPKQGLVEVAGNNTHGKSSLLDAIATGIGVKGQFGDGRRATNKDPVRHGADEGRIEIEFDEEFDIKCKVDKDGKPSYLVTGKDGRKYKPTMREAFYNAKTIDPLQFSRLSPKDQVEELQQLTGLNLSDLEEQRAEAFDERRTVNRRLKEMEAQINSMPKHDDAPEEEGSSESLAAELRQVQQQQASVSALQTSLASLRTKRKSLAAQIVNLEKELAAVDKEGKEKAKLLEEAPAPDVSVVEERMREITETNIKVRDNKERARAMDAYVDLTKTQEDLTKKLVDIDKEKDGRIAKAEMPIPGLAIAEGEVTYQGVPFSQASGAEKLRVSTAIGIAMNPKMKVLLIRDGSLLDDDNLEMLSLIAEKHDAQIWLERVGQEGTIVLEEGKIKNG